MAGGGRSRQAADAMRPPRLPPPLAADRGRRPAGVRAERRPTDLLILAVACMGAHARAPLFDPPAAPGLPPVGDDRLSAGRRPPRSSPARAPSPPPADRVSRTWGEVCVLARCELEPSAREKLHWQRTYGYRQSTHAAHQGACTWAYARSPVAQDEQIAGEAHEILFQKKKANEILGVQLLNSVAFAGNRVGQVSIWHVQVRTATGASFKAQKRYVILLCLAYVYECMYLQGPVRST